MIQPPASALMSIVRRRYNKTISLQQRVDTPDNQGGSTSMWVEFASVRAAIQPTTGEERLAQATAQNVASHHILFDYRSDVTPAHRAVDGSRVFDIQDVTDLAEQQMITQLDVKERFAK